MLFDQEYLEITFYLKSKIFLISPEKNEFECTFIEIFNIYSFLLNIV